MEEKKHIDRLFQEKFKDFEVSPDAKIWKNIEERLVKKKKRRIFPLWLRLGGAAAALLALISTGVWLLNTEKSTISVPTKNTIITNVASDKTTEDPEETKQVITQTDKESGTKNIKPVKQEVTIDNNYSTTTTNHKTERQSTELVVSFKPEPDNLITTNKETKTPKELQKLQPKNLVKESIVANSAIATTEKESQKDITKVIEENTVVTKEEKIKKWSVGSTVAPIYFNTLRKGSPIDVALTDNTKSTDVSISYGVKVNYKLSNKISLQSGINTVDLSYNTENVTTLISSNQALTRSTNVNTNVEGLNVVTTSADNIAARNIELAPQRLGFLNLNGDLNQSLSYIEIPMELKYNLIEKKLGINAIGGFSTFVLYRNGVTLQSEGSSTTLGEASNINDVNFSGNLGLDFDYKVTKKLFINVSPMFKYQFNTFSKNAGGFQPYYFGVYTGLNFKF